MNFWNVRYLPLRSCESNDQCSHDFAAFQAAGPFEPYIEAIRCSKFLNTLVPVPYTMASNRDETIYGRVKRLCRHEGKYLDDSLLHELKSIISTNPEAVRERDRHDELLHLAAENRSVGFVKLLFEQDSTALRTRNWLGQLPFHVACRSCNVETAKFLYHMYPESINVQEDEDKGYPLNIFLCWCDPRSHVRHEYVELLGFLLQHDRDGVRTPINMGNLPLHYACRRKNLAAVRLLYDSYPEAIFSRNRYGRTPLDEARYEGAANVESFLETQLDILRVAREERHPDANGQFFIHRVLQRVNMFLGAIKLIIQVNPESITAADNQGTTPLHIACRVGNVKASKCIVGAREDTLMARDAGDNLPIHIACWAGKCNSVNYLMTTNECGVSKENAKGKLPIELLLLHGDVDDRDSIEYVEATYLLLRSNPVEAFDRLSGTEHVDV